MRYSLAVLKVKDAEAWLENYHSEQSEANRREIGEAGWQIFRVQDEPNTMVLLNEWDDEAKATAFLTSPDLKAMQEASGVIDSQIILLDSADQGSV